MHRSCGESEQFDIVPCLLVNSSYSITLPCMSNRSTQNVQIERLWVDVGKQVGYVWRAFFLRLERFHRLRASSPSHLWLLHHLFLADINAACLEFQTTWHPLPRFKQQKQQWIFFVYNDGQRSINSANSFTQRYQ